MAWLPYERVVLRTRLSADEVLQRLRASVEPTRCLQWPYAAHKPFGGKVTDNRFELRRTLGSRTRPLPTVKGYVRAEAAGTVLEATLVASPATLLFVGVWLTFVLIGTLLTLFQTIFRGESPALAQLAGMFLWGYLLMQGTYWIGTRTVKRFLGELVDPAVTLSDLVSR